MRHWYQYIAPALIIAMVWLLPIATRAQSTAGLTGVRDTGYSIRSEYNKLKKAYPFIRVPDDGSYQKVLLETDKVYCRSPRDLKLDVIAPAKKGRADAAAIMIIHGGGWRSGDRSQHHSLALRLASLGYVCFTPEYRLSTEALYPAAVDDLRAALGWIASQSKKYGFSRDKIVVAGFSAGGQLAALLATTTGIRQQSTACLAPPTQLAALVDLDGTLSFTHVESGEGDDSKKTSAASYWFGYSKKDGRAIWEDASPLKHVGPKTPPTLFINSSVARMHAGRDDFMSVLKQYKIPVAVKTFITAPHSFPLFEPWIDSTVSVIDSFLKATPLVNTFRSAITVAADGSGDFASVQEAFNSIPLGNTKRVTIHIRPGIYREKLFLDSTKNNISLEGEVAERTVLVYADHTGKISPGGDTINTYTSQSFFIGGDGFRAKNISFVNDAGFNAGQAVAVHVRADRCAFLQCRFTGFQDVLFLSAAGKRQYFEDCYIEGTTDFIFGASIAWFENCVINSKKNSHITAASTPADQPFGFVFNRCKLIADTSIDRVSLGRPWRPYASVTYLYTEMGKHITSAGWDNWKNVANEKTARFSEYKNSGPGGDRSSRLPWTKELREDEAKKITKKAVLKNWDPKKDLK